MDYYVWYDESVVKTAAEKIQEAMVAYRARFTIDPAIILVHGTDQTSVHGVVVRTEATVQRNNFWLELAATTDIRRAATPVPAARSVTAS